MPERERGVKEEETRLVTRPVEGRPRLLDEGSNAVYMVRLTGGGLGIFKPGSGEGILQEQEDLAAFKASRGRLYRRERVAWLMSEALGIHLVPTTVIRTVNGTEGSLQEYIAGAVNLGGRYWDVAYARKVLLADELYMMAIFDHIMRNKDRKLENVLRLASGKMYLIDNGLSCDPWDEGYIGYNLENFVIGRSAPEQLMEGVLGLARVPLTEGKLYDEILKLIPERAVMAMKARLDLVAAQLSNDGELRRIDMEYFPREW